MRRALSRSGWLALAACWLALCAPSFADSGLHPLWEVHGKRNTVYILGSIHVLRPSDYPLAPVVQDAYSSAKTIFMEVDLGAMDSQQLQGELLARAQLPQGKTLPGVMGKQRYERAAALAHEVGVDLTAFDAFAPWFVAEAISQLQLAQLGFGPESGVEMYFLGRARSDGKSVAGLETVHDQIAIFDGMSLDAQAEYLLASLDEARDLPKDIEAMVHAWQHGDTAWFDNQLKSEFGRDPKLYESLLVSRNRKWVPKIAALLNDDKNYLVIVGNAHLVGAGSVIELLKKEGIAATQR
jgi:uncharacterized protein